MNTRKTSKWENTQQRRLRSNRSKAKAATAAKYTNRARESTQRKNRYNFIYTAHTIQHDPIRCCWWWWWRRRERLLGSHTQNRSFFFLFLHFVCVCVFFSFYFELSYCCIFSHIRRFSRAVSILLCFVCVYVSLEFEHELSVDFETNGMDWKWVDVPGSRYFLASDSFCMEEIMCLGTKRLLCQNVQNETKRNEKCFVLSWAVWVDIVYKWMDGVSLSSMCSQAHTHTYFRFNINFVVLSFVVKLWQICTQHIARSKRMSARAGRRSECDEVEWMSSVAECVRLRAFVVVSNHTISRSLCLSPHIYARFFKAHQSSQLHIQLLNDRKI